MFSQGFKRSISTALFLALISLVLLNGISMREAMASPIPSVASIGAASNQVFLPVLQTGYPRVSPFGVDPGGSLATQGLMQYAKNLDIGWTRLGQRISWIKLQPEEGGPINWDLLAEFEQELRALRTVGIAPIVVVQDSPHWAVRSDARSDGQLTSCAALQPEKYPAFANFLVALINRYKTPEFNVHNWELGNEPDMDPDSVPVDNGFGCWGDADDPFFGGRSYGEMLKSIVPAMRAADPQIKVWTGGLILSTPPVEGGPVGSYQFLRGVLEAGAAPHFDVVPYHWYTSYWQYRTDYDLIFSSPWTSWGGGVVGKASYLRQVMNEYGVDKPVFLNETAFGCPNDWTFYEWCATPDEAFYQAQADYAVRSFTRGLGAGIMGFAWYALQDPGWRYTGLLQGEEMKPVYLAYQQMSNTLAKATYVGPADYGNEIEGYVFRKNGRTIQVVWAREDKTLALSVPRSRFVSALSRDGGALTPELAGSNYMLAVGFEPVYIILY